LLVAAVVLLGIVTTTLLIGSTSGRPGPPALSLTASAQRLSSQLAESSKSGLRPPSAPAGFVVRSGTSLFLDGRPFRFTGLNIYNANSLWTCAYPLGEGPDLDASLDAIGPGQTVFRAFFFQRMATTKGKRDWRAFDHTLAVAKAHRERVIVTLTNQWGVCEEPLPGYKTEAWYQSGYKSRLDTSVPSGYRDWVAEVVSRYRSDPTVLAWQLVNEAEDSATDKGPCTSTAPASLKAFAADMGQFVKSIDANHLISLGTMGSGQCGGWARDFADVHSVATIDLCEYHDYNASTSPMPGDQFNGLQVRVDQCRALDKPVFVGETGIEAGTVGGYAARARLFADKFRAQFDAGVVGELIWNWRTGPRGGSSLTNFEVGPGDPVLRVLERQAPRGLDRT
jgi:endo-1,4-beta-mannosidase